MVIACLTSNAQFDSGFHFFKKYNYQITSFTVNALGEIYFIDKNNELKKFNEKGDSVGVYNEVTKYGKLSFVEADNPWRTLLFYKNFSTIVLLDKYLKPITNINLRKRNIFRVNSVIPSYDNNIWVFDEENSKIIKINDQGNVLLESVDLRTVIDSVPSPVRMIDRDAYLYLYDTLKGLYVFDHFGTFKNKLPFTHWKSVFINGKNIYGVDDECLYIYTNNSLSLKKYDLPPGFRNYSSIHIANNKIYLLKNNQLEVFQFN